MKRVLVTGASGFIGANLVRRLLHERHEVHVLLRDKHKTWRLKEIIDDLHVHNVDIQNAEGVRKAISKVKPDWIFHTAIYGAYSSQNSLSQMISTNVQGTANLLEAAADVGCDAFINTGSSSEYGYTKTAPREDAAIVPNSEYAITKAAATHLSQYVARTTDVRIATLRLYSIYGPYEEATRLFPTLLAHAQRGVFPPLVGASTAHDYVYVDDVVEAYLLAAKTKTKELGGVFNIGSGKQVTMRELVSIVRSTYAMKQKPVWGSMPARKWDTSCWVANPAKASKMLHWKADTSLQEGIRRTSTWLESHMSEYKKSLPKQ